MSGAIRAHDLGLDVLVVEKSDKYGGSTAMSGGVCWVGNNPDMSRVGIGDSDDEVLEYLRHITKGEVEDDRLIAYRDESKRVLAYLSEKGHMAYDALALYTDYYPEAPGGKPGGRSMDPRPFNATRLGDEFFHLRAPHPQSQIMGKFGITAAQAHTFLTPSWKMKFTMLWFFVLYALRFFGRKKYGRDTYLTAGNALIARLRMTMLDRGIEMWREAPAKGVIERDGRVVGAVVEHNGKTVRVEARKGVLLAAGGFEKNLQMREEYQPHPITTEWTATRAPNEGDGIRMGMELGGDVALMDEAWWTPVTMVPKSDVAWVLVVEKSLPGGIFVDSDGKRFTNEAAPYIDVVHGMYKADNGDGLSVPAWLVFDARFRHNFPCGPLAPGYAMPDSRIPRRYRKGFLHKGKTLAELADVIGVPAANLQQTVTTFNAAAVQGKDPDFGRGLSASDRYYGDHRVEPNPCLGAVENAPFYAIRVYPGDLGTKGGLRTNTAGEVLREDGGVIEGLYAAGNSSASVMGRSYPGAGGTIGPALTFGFLAAEAAHERAASTTAAPAEAAE